MKILDQKFNDITYYVARATEMAQDDRGVLVGGCGMDMSLALMEELTWCLYGGGYYIPGIKGNGGRCIDWKTTY